MFPLSHHIQTTQNRNRYNKLTCSFSPGDVFVQPGDALRGEIRIVET